MPKWCYQKKRVVVITKLLRPLISEKNRFFINQYINQYVNLKDRLRYMFQRNGNNYSFQLVCIKRIKCNYVKAQVLLYKKTLNLKFLHSLILKNLLQTSTN